MNVVKYLQAQGVGSRKECHILIEEAAVEINHRLVISAHQEIRSELVDSLLIYGEPQHIVPLPYFCLVLNKPKNFEVSHKPKYYPSIFSLLPGQIRNLPLQAIGRLDVDTTGLLLITNDGKLNHRLTSPKHDVEKEYLINLKYEFDLKQEQKLLQGVLLKDDNEIVKAKSVQIEAGRLIKMVITTGKYHQIKRMIAAVGNRVESLHRTRFGKLNLPCDLQISCWRFVTPEVI
ncbi:MAG: pseudouridine synthase [Neisseriaceae bacterium]|nr:MAG: pseudouridine synthase [Neisseriaceae bacterium]